LLKSDHLFIHLLNFTGIDIKTVSLIGSTLAASSTAKGIVDNGPKFVLCSSAGVTRPFWSEKKKLALGLTTCSFNQSITDSLTHLFI